MIRTAIAFEPFKYVYASGLHLIFLMGLSIPIFARAGPVEQSMPINI
jgi:hypothetical protein